MSSFSYHSPGSIIEAVELLNQYKGSARPFLGGTDLLVRVTKGHVFPQALVDLKKVSDISKTITLGSGFLIIGARIRIADFLEDQTAAALFPALAKAASKVGSVQIRNRATLTGNICNASPAADMVPPLALYKASVDIAGSEGSRRVAVQDFIQAPGKTGCRTGEIVTAIRIPVPVLPYGAAFERITRRRGVDLATVNLACGIDCHRKVTFVFGAAGPVTVSVSDDSGILLRSDIHKDARDRKIDEMVDSAAPISDVRAGADYRKGMLSTLGKRALSRALNSYLAGGPEDG